MTADQVEAPPPLVSARGVVKAFDVRAGAFARAAAMVRAVDGVDLDIRAGEVLGLVGESGSGKSTLGRVLLGILPADEGTVTFDGIDVQHAKGKQLKDLRRQLQIVFQDPYSSLDPRTTVGDSIAEGLRAQRVPAKQRRDRVEEMLEDLQSRLDFTLLLVAHDLAVVEHLCDRVAVMYLGRIVETGTRDQVFDDPQHPYTRALLSAIPVADPEHPRSRTRLKGDLPSPLDPPSGCTFHTRCPIAVTGVCDVEVPQLVGREGDPDHPASCHLRTGDHQDLDPERAEA